MCRAATSPLAYVRLHGRNAATWNARGGSASDRFDYLYSPEELEEWVEPLRGLGAKAEEVYVLFNNNRWSRTPQGEPRDFIGRDHQQGQINAPHTGQHIFDKIAMARHIHNADLFFSQSQPGKAEINSHQALFFLRQPVRINPGQRLDQRGFAMIHMSGGTDNVHKSGEWRVAPLTTRHSPLTTPGWRSLRSRPGTRASRAP